MIKKIEIGDLAQWFSIREIELIKKGTYKPIKSIKKEI